jgi:chitinase
MTLLTLVTGPYVYAHTNLTEIDQTMDLMWRNKIDPSKVTLGLGFYGRSFTLSDPSCTGPGCGFSAGGDPGSCTASAGTLSFAEIEDVIANKNPTVTLDSKAGVKIVTWNGNRKCIQLLIQSLTSGPVKIGKG